MITKPEATVDAYFGEHALEGLPLERQVAAKMIRSFRTPTNRALGFTAMRILRTSHVVLRTPNGNTVHVTWPESEVRVQARLARELSGLGLV